MLLGHCDFCAAEFKIIIRVTDRDTALGDCGGQLVGQSMQRMLAPSQRKLLNQGCVSLGWYQKDRACQCGTGIHTVMKKRHVFPENFQKILNAHSSL